MIDGLGEGAIYNAELLCYLSGVWKELTYPDSLIVVVVFFELILRRADWKAFLSRGHSCDTLTISNVLR